MTRYHDPDDKFWRPRDEEAHPPTIKSADGSTTLYRFRVDGVIYRASRKAAEDQLDQAGLYMEAAAITDPLEG